MYPRLVARARHSAAEGYAAATIELPGSGDRPRSAAAEEARADLRRALTAGQPVSDEIVDRLVLPLVEKAVPEWRAALDALLALPEIGGPVGYAGGVIAIGIRMAVAEPRIVAAFCSPGASCPAPVRGARQVTIPLRSCSSGTTKETTGSWPWTCSTPSAPRRRHCYANMGGHTGVPPFEGGRRKPVLRPASRRYAGAEEFYPAGPAIFRDLLVGPRRYGALAAGLPRIPTNILAARLKELQAAGVLRRVPHSRVVVYELTSYGRELEPVVLASAPGFQGDGRPPGGADHHPGLDDHGPPHRLPAAGGGHPAGDRLRGAASVPPSR